jgi:flagellar biosynthesis protein FliP
LDRFADISAQKLVDGIAAKKEPPLERFLFGLGIRHVGMQTATSPRDFSQGVQILIWLTILTLAPSIFIMTTAFIRIIIVLALARQLFLSIRNNFDPLQFPVHDDPARRVYFLFKDGM